MVCPYWWFALARWVEALVLVEGGGNPLLHANLNELGSKPAFFRADTGTRNHLFTTITTPTSPKCPQVRLQTTYSPLLHHRASTSARSTPPIAREAEAPATRRAPRTDWAPGQQLQTLDLSEGRQLLDPVVSLGSRGTSAGIRMHYTAEHCLVNCGFPLLWC